MPHKIIPVQFCVSRKIAQIKQKIMQCDKVWYNEITLNYFLTEFLKYLLHCDPYITML